MALADRTPVDWVTRLGRRHDDEKQEIIRLNRHYDLEQPLDYMHPEVWLEVADRIKPVLIAWPQVVVDSVEERLDVEGFRYADDPNGKDDDRLWEWWQANNLDEGSEQEHLEALIGGRGFVTVGSNADDDKTPLIAVESALQMTADFDPQTRKVRAALKRWIDEGEQFATLYLPNATYFYQLDGNGVYQETSVDDHELGRVPVVPFVNRGRILRMRDGQVVAPGRSELAPILPLSDAACKIATDMMVAAETVAIPSRYIFGVAEDEFVDKDGNNVSPWKTVLGKLLANESHPDEISAGQWPAADLSNFHNTLNELARMVAAIGALPPHYLGFTTDNPASADAIRSNEARLVKRAERKQVSFGESWEQVMALGIRIVDGEWDDRAPRLETRWRDAATPTSSQKADAAVKLTGAGIIPPQQAQEDLGYTEGQKQRMRQWQKDNAAQAAAVAAANPMSTPQAPASNAVSDAMPMDDTGAPSPVMQG